MSERPTEERVLHTRLMKCALEVEESRAYWQRVEPGKAVTAQEAFESWWFGSLSLPATRVLLTNLRARFDAFPPSLRVLHAWADMDPGTRVLLCHWHLQLSDPLYRVFTGDWLVKRREGPQPAVTRDVVFQWVGEQGPGRWTVASRIQIASKLLSSAYAAGLVGGNRDPRPLVLPRVPDDALTYLLHLLRAVDFEGTLLNNPYLRSVGLAGALLEDRLRGLSSLTFRRQGSLVDFEWHHAGLEDWFRGSRP